MRLDSSRLVLDLNSIHGNRSTGSFSIPMMEVAWNLEDITPALPEGTLELTVIAREMMYVCRGVLNAEFITRCARCLENAVFGIDTDIYRIYTWDERLADDLDAEMISRNDGTVSILDAVREAVILSVPGKPLCCEGCRGLCTICGVNLNVSSCEHTSS